MCFSGFAGSSVISKFSSLSCDMRSLRTYWYGSVAACKPHIQHQPWPQWSAPETRRNTKSQRLASEATPGNHDYWFNGIPSCSSNSMLLGYDQFANGHAQFFAQDTRVPSPWRKLQIPKMVKPEWNPIDLSGTCMFILCVRCHFSIWSLELGSALVLCVFLLP